jgi:hypothetical protein
MMKYVPSIRRETNLLLVVLVLLGLLFLCMMAMVQAQPVLSSTTTDGILSMGGLRSEAKPVPVPKRASTKQSMVAKADTLASISLLQSPPSTTAN